MGKKARYYFTIQELQQKALKAWKTYAEEYRNLVPKYQSLLSKKRWLKMNERGYGNMPIRRLNKSVLEEFVQIPFFDIKSEKDAVDFVHGLEYGELNNFVATIYAALDDHSYRTIKSRISDYEHEIKYWKYSRAFGYDPTYPVSSSQHARSTVRRSSGSSDE